MANLFGYMATGLLGGAGQGISKNAETEMEQWKQQAEEIRQRSLMTLQQEYQTTAEQEQNARNVEQENVRYERGRKDKELDDIKNRIQHDKDVQEQEQFELKKVGIQNKNKLAQIEATGKQNRKTAAAKPDKYKNEKYKATMKAVDEGFVTDFINHRKTLPADQQNLGDFSSTDALTGAIKYDMSKILANAPKEMVEDYKATKLLAEKIIKQTDMYPEKAYTLAKQDVANKRMQKNLKKMSTHFKLPADDIKTLSTAPVTDKFFTKLGQLKTKDPKYFKKVFKFLQTTRPKLIQQYENRQTGGSNSLNNPRGTMVAPDTPPGLPGGFDNTSAPSVMDNHSQGNGLLNDQYMVNP